MICPRCDKNEGLKCSDAPKEGSWEMYRCQYCDFVWRSTEKEYLKNKDLYDPIFKLDEEKIREMGEKPAIPPLRKK